VSRLYVIGAGGHGAVIAEAAVEMARWQDILFLDDNETLDTVVDIPVAGRPRQMFTLADEDSEFIVAMGNNRQRLQLCNEIIENGYRLATVIHPAACISRSATVSSGTVACAGAIVNARAKIGRACILNTGATVDHDCELGDSVHVSPGANIAGNVRIGQCSWIGIGSSIREGMTIGCDSIVGAGSAVVGDVGDAVTVGGVPARRLGN
jgi:sugar O-acyltransferase (sialic acid O-acetyltransferase NeuD family)